ncbi:hypothetical protein LCGC14_0015230 [marine sediment metagenome]|uniref:Polysulfide reductase NrfD n=1 Tax=marine sediment metagenome TaxID=412755 RepID=A0A0F9WEZ5_9ZZZZ|nr:hypothetical protein [Phycisphaerae bacterium]HDZ43862.1 hypothetical protein [Phycisphaerae bacterium]
MPQVIFYDVNHHEAMGLLVVIYFFMSGLGAGAFLTGAAFQLFGGPNGAKIAKRAAIAAPILLIPGLLCLMLDLGQPMRFFNLMLYFNVQSIASWGVWLINIFMGLSVLFALLHFAGKAKAARPLAYLGSVFAIAVGLYSGMLLYQMRGYELWHSALVPPIFLVSAIASGMAVVLLLSRGSDPQAIRTLTRALAVVIGVDLVLALTEILTLVWSHGAKGEAADVILSGGFGFMFIGLYLILGLVLPLLLLMRRQAGRGVYVTIAVMVLVGTLAMRFVIVIGGQAVPLS